MPRAADKVILTAVTIRRGASCSISLGFEKDDYFHTPAAITTTTCISDGSTTYLIEMPEAHDAIDNTIAFHLYIHGRRFFPKTSHGSITPRQTHHYCHVATHRYSQRAAQHGIAEAAQTGL